MKRIISTILLFLLLCSLFTGCGAQTEEPTVPAPIQMDTPAPESVDVLENTGTEGTMKLIKAQVTLWDNTTTNESGLYKCRIDHNGVSLLYYEYASMTLDFLMEGADANADSYTANVPGHEGGTIPAVCGDHLYVISVGTTPIHDFEGYPSKVFQFGLDGSNRKELALPDEMRVNRNSGVAGDGHGLYLMLQALDFSTRSFGDWILFYIDEDMSEAKEITRFPKEGLFSVDIYGATGNELVLRIASLQEGYEDAETLEKMKHLDYSWIRLNPETLEQTEFLHYKTGDISIAYDWGDIMYTCPIGGTEIRILHVSEGRDEHLMDVNDILELRENEQVRLFDPVLDGRFGIVAYIEEPYESHKYHCDPKTGELVEMKMYYYEDDESKPIAPVAETEDSFVVLSGSIWYTEPDTMNGQTFMTNRIEAYLTMMDKCDYWSNTKRLRPFEDHVFPEDADIKSDRGPQTL